MKNIDIFEGIEKENINKMLTCFEARTITFKKERIIASYIGNINMIGILLKGSAEIVRYDIKGNRTIIDTLNENSLFGEIFSTYDTNELSIIATSDCEVLFIDYNYLIKRCKKACPYHSKLVDNVLKLLSNKVVDMNERIEILAKRSIRDKLLTYFAIISKRKLSNSFVLPFSYIDLADYLSIDRSAMMREIKYLKDEGFIKTNKRKIILLYK